MRDEQAPTPATPASAATTTTLVPTYLQRLDNALVFASSCQVQRRFAALISKGDVCAALEQHVDDGQVPKTGGDDHGGLAALCHDATSQQGEVMRA